MAALASDDGLELALRRLSSFIYEKRTGDKSGAVHMLGVAPPGAEADVAPTWMVEGASTHSKAEYQRDQRVKWSESHSSSSTSKGKGKGKDKGGGRGKGGRGRGRGDAPE